MKQTTRYTTPSIRRTEKKMIETAIDWKTRLFTNDAEALSMAIWNKFGYRTSTDNGSVLIWASREIIARI